MSFFKKIESFFLDSDKAFVLRFSLFTLLSFAFFFSFGFYGYFTDPSLGFFRSLLITAGFLLVFLFLFFLQDTREKIEIVITHGQVRMCIFHSIVLVFFTFPYIFLPMSGDNFYHTQQAFVHGIKIIEKIGSHASFLSPYSFAFLLQIVSLLAIVFSAILVYMLQKYPLWFRASLYGVIFVMGRMVVLYFGGNTSPFPPFRLFPLFFSGSIFGIQEFSFRLASLLSVAVLSVYVWNEIRKTRSGVLSWYIVVSIFTIPLLLHVATLVESSVFAFVVVTYVLLRLLRTNLSVNEYTILSVAIAIASAIRISVFVMFVPLLVHFLFFTNRNMKDVFIFIKRIVPILLFTLCFVIVSFVEGSPASYKGEAYTYLGVVANATFFERIIQAFHGGYVYAALYNSLHFIVAIPLLLFLLLKRKLLVVYVLFFLVSLALFFSISPGLWGNGRYQAEYVLPLVVVTLVTLFQKIKHFAVVPFAFLLLLYNLILFYSLPQMNKGLVGFNSYFENAKERGGYFVLSEMPFDYRGPLSDLRERGFGGSVYYLPGDGYSYITKIIAGYSIFEMEKEKEMKESIGMLFSTTTASLVSENEAIEYVILHRAPKSKEFSNEQFILTLDKRKWQLQNQYFGVPYGTLVEVYHRKSL